MDATSPSSGGGSPAPYPAASVAPLEPGGALSPAKAAMSSSGSSISRRAMRASSLAAANTSFSSRIRASTSSVYLLSALKPLSGTMVPKSVSADASSVSGAGGTALTTAAPASAGTASGDGTRTMYTHSLSRTARRRLSSTVCCSPVSTPVRLMLQPLTALSPAASSRDATCSRTMAVPISSSLSSAILAARVSASAWNAAALAAVCASQVRSK
mmetsp:Transcript_3185/g.7833  ORF Transcript_3185/g.7833 Transcript_3185/m.7833 type:complete len:214 (-) Transcript_3185:810-1451(-)